MNLWFRLIGLFFTAWRAAPIATTDDVSRVALRVWPSDLDTSLHMNNGRYLTIMDLGRMDWTVRCGLLKIVLRKKWVPVATTVTARFVREMRCWQKFHLETRIVGWLDTQRFFEHRFLFDGGSRHGELAAVALVKAGIYDRPNRRMVPIDALLEITTLHGTRRDLREDIVVFLEAEARMNAVSKRKMQTQTSN